MEGISGGGDDGCLDHNFLQHNSNEHEIDRTHAEGRGYSTQAERKSDIDKRENKNSPTQRQ